MKELARDLEVQDLVSFIGWIPFEQVSVYIASADIGVVPHVNNGFINTTMPNKIFQYMLLEKAVLTSDALPLRRVVRECDCGRYFRSGDAADAAKQIAMLLDPLVRKRYGQNGVFWVHKKYNWDATVSPYFTALERLANAGL